MRGVQAQPRGTRSPPLQRGAVAEGAFRARLLLLLPLLLLALILMQFGQGGQVGYLRGAQHNV